jgi:hypothetical protein
MGQKRLFMFGRNKGDIALQGQQTNKIKLVAIGHKNVSDSWLALLDHNANNYHSIATDLCLMQGELTSIYFLVIKGNQAK